MLITVLFYIFVVLTGIQILYYLIFSTFLFKNKTVEKSKEKKPISVIVFAKNNAIELEKKLSLILKQKYPIFEVLVVNSDSDDETTEVLETFYKNHENLKIINVENNEAFWANKKYALTLGIKAAKYDNLLFTDANSSPLSEFWIAKMSLQFSKQRTIILGYKKYTKQATITNILARFENLLTGIKMFSFAKLNSPIMAFNNNLAYHRSEFFKVKGFIYHIKIKNGEGDLFLRDAATKENISYSISKNSFIENNSPTSFKEWYNYLLEKNTIKKEYKAKSKFILSFFKLSKTLFYTLGTALFFYYPWEILLPIVLSYFVVQYIIIGISAKKLNEPYLIFFLPFLDISLLLIQISIFIANSFSKSNR